MILICPTHHAVVDGQSNTYTVADLRRWKTEHERWVHKRLIEEIASISFAELQVVTEGILAIGEAVEIDFRVTDPSQKVARNSLTSKEVLFQLTMGLAKAKEVSKFVEHVATLDASFPDRLKAGFVREYDRLRGEGISGDELFQTLVYFVGRNCTVFRQQAAALAVVAYLFEKCEIFEA